MHAGRFAFLGLIRAVLGTARSIIKLRSRLLQSTQKLLATVHDEISRRAAELGGVPTRNSSWLPILRPSGEYSWLVFPTGPNFWFGEIPHRPGAMFRSSA